MKKALLFLILAGSMANVHIAKGQSFSMQYTSDTVYATVATAASPSDNIKNNTGSNLGIRWHVDSTDFPADWLTAAAFGICDNVNCRNNTGNILWNPSTTSGNLFRSTYYANTAHDSTGGFSLSLDFSNVTHFGSHWITINVTDTVSNYHRDITFIINKIPTAVPGINNAAPEINVYPNPAHGEINAVYDANADVKTIAVYNIIGRTMLIYKVNNTSANLNIENLPSGIYFARFVNGEGRVVATKKFTRQ